MTGVVLAGGESRRMGRPKAFLEFKGKALIRHSLDLLQSFCSDVLIVAKDPEPYRALGVPAVTDLHPERGPMAGIHAGLSRAENFWSLVLPCDMPFVRRELLEGLKRRITEEDSLRPAVIPLAPGDPGGELIPQVLCAAYGKTCLPCFAEKIKEGRMSLRHEMRKIGAAFIPWLGLDPEDRSASSFVNLNTPGEYAEWRSRGMESLQANPNSRAAGRKFLFS